MVCGSAPTSRSGKHSGSGCRAEKAGSSPVGRTGGACGARAAPGFVTVAPVLLSDRDIRAELESGRVVLDPYEPTMLQPSLIDVRLDTAMKGSPSAADLQGAIVELQSGDTVVVP